jgi:hypothetical protein
MTTNPTPTDPKAQIAALADWLDNEATTTDEAILCPEMAAAAATLRLTIKLLDEHEAFGGSDYEWCSIEFLMVEQALAELYPEVE